MFYVIEVQSSATGAVIPFVFDNQAAAEAKYHDILRVAAESAVPYHGAMIFTDKLFIVKSEVYSHVEEPEPEA